MHIDVPPTSANPRSATRRFARRNCYLLTLTTNSNRQLYTCQYRAYVPMTSATPIWLLVRALRAFFRQRPHYVRSSIVHRLHKTEYIDQHEFLICDDSGTHRLTAHGQAISVLITVMVNPPRRAIDVSILLVAKLYQARRLPIAGLTTDKRNVHSYRTNHDDVLQRRIP